MSTKGCGHTRVVDDEAPVMINWRMCGANPTWLSKEETMLDPCQTDIYENGTQVFLTHTIPAKELDKWVKKIAKDCGQPVDWHYAGGRALILALGDLDKVKASLKKFRPEHDELYHKASIVYMGEDYDSSRAIEGLWRYSNLSD